MGVILIWISSMLYNSCQKKEQVFVLSALRHTRFAKNVIDFTYLTNYLKNLPCLGDVLHVLLVIS